MKLLGKFLRFLQRVICVPINYLIIKCIWGGVWNMKLFHPQFVNNKYQCNIWHKYFQKQGSWIGENASFEGIPYFPHECVGIFISQNAHIGKNCIIFHHVTIGSNQFKDSNYGSPVIGDNCYIGAGAMIIGNVHIGNNCRIGANTCVTKDMPDNTVAVSAQTRYIHKDNIDNRMF